VVPVQESVPVTNQFGFILQNNNGNYSANVRLLSDPGVSQVENQFSENNSTFMNASKSIQENMWYKAEVEVSKGELKAELRGENGTLLKNLSVKEEATDGSECGIIISCTPDAFVAFKNLKVENLDQPPSKSIGDIKPPEREELLAPYIISLMLLGTVATTITYLRKSKGKRKRIQQESQT
jgi:hypothetical protein